MTTKCSSHQCQLDMLDEKLTTMSINDNGMRKLQRAWQPAAQKVINVTNVNYKRKAADPQPISTVFQQTDPHFTIYLEPMDVAKVKESYIEFDLTFAQEAPWIMPMFQWLNRLEYWVRGGQYIQTIRPIDYIQWFHTLCHKKRKYYLDICKAGYVKTPEWSKIGLRPQITSNGKDLSNIRQYLPLIGLFRTHLIDMSRIKDEIELRFYFETDFIAGCSLFTSGAFARSDITLNSVHWVFLQDDLSRQDILNSPVHGRASKYNYLDNHIIKETTKTLTASTNVKFSLQTLDGIVPYLMFFVREGVNPTGLARMCQYDIGKDASFDFQSATSESLWGNGQHIRADLIKQLNIRNLGEWFKGYYYIPWCNDIKKAYHGVIDGFQYFNSTTKYLSVNFGEVYANPPTDIFAITRPIDHATDYKLHVPNDRVNYDENAVGSTIVPVAGSLALYIEKLRKCCSVYAAAVIENVVAAGTDASDVTTVTFSGRDAGKMRMLPAPMEVGNTTPGLYELTTNYPYEQWTSGSSYEVTIIAPIYKCFTISANGHISVETIQ